MKNKAPFTLGIDIGTSGIKAIVFDAEGYCTDARSVRRYSMQNSCGQAGELSPDEVFDAVVLSCCDVVNKHKENNKEDIEPNHINKSIVYFNENELYINDPIIQFHKGYYDYLVNKGFIVQKDNNICRKLVGIGGCDKYKSKPNPYRIL